MTAQELLYYPNDHIRKHAELVRGVMYVNEPSGLDSSVVGMRIAGLLASYVFDHNLGLVTGEAGGYILERNPDTVRAPDIAFLSRERYANGESTSGFFDGAPDLAIEVLSPSNSRRKIHIKTREYLAAGTHAVWVVDMWSKTVTIHRIGMPVQRIENGGVADADDIIPGFQLELAKIWP